APAEGRVALPRRVVAGRKITKQIGPLWGEVDVRVAEDRLGRGVRRGAGELQLAERLAQEGLPSARPRERAGKKAHDATGYRNSPRQLSLAIPARRPDGPGAGG